MPDGPRHSGRLGTPGGRPAHMSILGSARPYARACTTIATIADLPRKETSPDHQDRRPSTPTRHERRLAARAAGGGNAAPRGARIGAVGDLPADLDHRRASGSSASSLIGALLLLQGTAPEVRRRRQPAGPDGPTPGDLADGRTLGKADAPVTLEVWSDYQCPACEQFAELVEPVLVRTYVTTGTLRIVDHDAAFQGATGSRFATTNRSKPAAGARCAADQDAYWPFHDWLFANQVGENQGAFRDERLRAIATAAGLDVVAWDACRATGEQQAAVRAETKARRSPRASTPPRRCTSTARRSSA